MRKWLTALLFLLLALPSARAEDALTHALNGLWQWNTQSPPSALGGGVYFHADGSCALYDAASFLPHNGQVHTLTLREEGTWEQSGGMLVITTPSATFVLTAELRSGADVCWTELLALGQSCFYPASPADMDVPLESTVLPAVMEAVRAFHPDDDIEDYAELPNAPGGPMAFVLIHDGQRRMLLGYQLTEGRWESWLDAVQAIPQGDFPDVWITTRQGGGSYDHLWYDPARDDAVYPDAPSFGVLTSNGEYYEEQVEFIWQDGWHVISWADGPNAQVERAGNELVFYNISYGLDGRARCAFDTSLFAVDFYSLPRQVQDVRISGSGEPALPLSDAPNALAVQDVSLRPGKKYAVYTGPGKKYGRAAGGKASVSTNGWVQVFGEYDGYLLIHYAISDSAYRFGWITADALPRGVTVPELSFSFGDAMTTEEDVFLTDDPLNGQTELLALRAGDAVERLAQLGDGWSYVRVTRGKKVWWGFVYSWPLGHG